MQKKTLEYCTVTIDYCTISTSYSTVLYSMYSNATKKKRSSITQGTFFASTVRYDWHFHRPRKTPSTRNIIILRTITKLPPTSQLHQRTIYYFADHQSEAITKITGKVVSSDTSKKRERESNQAKKANQSKARYHHVVSEDRIVQCSR